MVSAANTAPVSSKLQSFSVMAARITAACQSNGMLRSRTHVCQYDVVSARKLRASVSGFSGTVSSAPTSRVIGRSSENSCSCRIAVIELSVVRRSTEASLK